MFYEIDFWLFPSLFRLHESNSQSRKNNVDEMMWIVSGDKVRDHHHHPSIPYSIPKKSPFIKNYSINSSITQKDKKDPISSLHRLFLSNTTKNVFSSFQKSVFLRFCFNYNKNVNLERKIKNGKSSNSRLKESLGEEMIKLMKSEGKYFLWF